MCTSTESPFRFVFGVPAFYGKSGKKFIGQPDDFGEKIVNEYIAKDYHQPSDEYDPSWDWSGAVRDLQIYWMMGRELADSSAWPNWRATRGSSRRCRTAGASTPGPASP